MVRISSSPKNSRTFPPRAKRRVSSSSIRSRFLQTGSHHNKFCLSLFENEPAGVTPAIMTGDTPQAVAIRKLVTEWLHRVAAAYISDQIGKNDESRREPVFNMIREYGRNPEASELERSVPKGNKKRGRDPTDSDSDDSFSAGRRPRAKKVGKQGGNGGGNGGAHGGGKSKKWCSVCSGEGHAGMHCIQKHKMDPQHAGKMCQTCHGKGHIARVCPNSH